MTLPIAQVDAFTDVAFSGNPAGVCLLPALGDAGWMQVVAAEMALPETAFLAARGDGAFDLRWFTPTTEVALCGHATLASAHLLWESGQVSPDVAIRFVTVSGPIQAIRDAARWIELDLPVLTVEPCPVPPEAPAALGGIPPVAAAVGDDWLVLELADEAAVRAVRPDLPTVARLHPVSVAITAASDSDGVDIVSRVFAPNEGIPEDPVTGSAHCALAPYWAPRLGRDRLVARQASARGGILRLHLRGHRVGVAGRAVTVFRGELVARDQDTMSTSADSPPRPGA